MPLLPQTTCCLLLLTSSQFCPFLCFNMLLHFLLPPCSLLFGLWNPLAKFHCRLVHLLRAIDCKVNLIVFNTHEGSRFQPSTTEAVLSFRSKLIQVTVSFKWSNSA